MNHRQIERRLHPVGTIVQNRLSPRRIRSVIVAVQARTHRQKIPQCHRRLARVRIRITRVTHVRQHSLIHSGQRSLIDRDAGQRTHNRLRRRTKLVRPVDVVSVEIFLHHQVAVLVEQHTVNIFVGAVQNAAHDCVGRSHTQCRVSDIANSNPIMQVGRHMVVIVRGQVLPLRAWARQSSRFR